MKNLNWLPDEVYNSAFPEIEWNQSIGKYELNIKIDGQNVNFGGFDNIHNPEFIVKNIKRKQEYIQSELGYGKSA